MPKLPSFGDSAAANEVGRPEVLLERARQAMRDGRPDDAARIYQRVLRIDPTNTDLCNDLGSLLAARGAFDEALTWYDNSLRVDPDQPPVWIERGKVLTRMGRLTEALAMFDRAIAIRPGHLIAHGHRAATLSRLGRFQDALAVYDVLVHVLPGDAGLAADRGVAAQWCGRFEEAHRDFDRAAGLDPGLAQAFFNKGQLLMLRGDLAAGLKLFDRYWRSAAGTGRPVPPGSRWRRDSDTEGKAVLVYWEQGIGDTIQHSRFISALKTAGAEVILEVQKPLVELMTTLPGVSRVICNEDPTPPYDYQCPLMSLAAEFDTTLDTIPSGAPYLRADPARVAAWRDRLAGSRRRRIGLVWAGRTNFGSSEMMSLDYRRSLPSLAALAPLAAVDGCSFVSLQVERPMMAPANMTIEDHGGALTNFAETAAAIENLDLVISVDTSTAHLAGAMGKPVWLLNRFDTDPRWLLDREDSPWYPTMRIFRQRIPGEWGPVIAQVAEALRAFAGD